MDGDGANNVDNNQINSNPDGADQMDPNQPVDGQMDPGMDGGQFGDPNQDQDPNQFNIDPNQPVNENFLGSGQFGD